MNKNNNILTNGNLIPMFICTPVAVVLSSLAVTLICLPFKVASFLETFLYSCLLFLVVAAIVEIPMLIVAYKSRLMSQKDNRHMIVTTLHCAEKCYGIKRKGD